MSRTRSMVLTAVSWGLLAAAWWRVLATESTPSAAMWLVPLAIVPVVMLVTWWWIAHNRKIFKRKGPRRSVPAATFDYSRDRRGREVSFDPSVPNAAFVMVEVHGGVKRYLGEPR